MTGMKRGNWSTHDLERLRALYPKSREESVARLLRRSVPSVQRKAREIFAVSPKKLEWSGGDDLRLREGFGVLDFNALCLVLGRSAADVSARIATMRTSLRTDRRWTRVEIGLLKRLYGSRSDEDLVVCLSRPGLELRAKAEELCLSKDKGFLAKIGDAKQPMPRWRTEEIVLLCERYPTSTNLNLAHRLHRSVASVANKANQLGLKKEPSVLREMGRRNVSARYRVSD
jgi:hypothetical protein